MQMHGPLASMTGFGAAGGEHERLAWAWELRSVNSKGLEIRFRLPPGWEAVEGELRQQLGRRIKRGSVNPSLTLKAEEQAVSAPDRDTLERLILLAREIADRIPGSPPPRAELLLALPGVFRSAATGASPTAPAPALKEAVLTGFEAALTALEAARREEGARLRTVLTGLLDEIATAQAAAVRAAEDQPRQQRARMLESVQALLAEGMSLPEERIAQEVALLASRSDVREELDRLASHIDAARALLAEGQVIGRKLDFLMQEFNREANTLCSKSASLALTATGLSLKALIEQLREQVQNVE